MIENAKPTKQGTRKQKFLLTKISKDDRLSPNKRMLAALLLGYIDGLYPYTLVECTYGMNALGRVRWTDREDGKDETLTAEQDKATAAATQQLTSLYDSIRGGDDGRKSTPSPDSGDKEVCTSLESQRDSNSD